MLIIKIVNLVNCNNLGSKVRKIFGICKKKRKKNNRPPLTPPVGGGQNADKRLGICPPPTGGVRGGPGETGRDGGEKWYGW